ncbi:actin-binding protein-like [Cyclospora cayetanensis]|uniref:Actin-binding protein-like n=1 Tax=Cyclospora cayetanensis TaxID=88456 RepID=A0A6P6RQZ5_9EIME|nr:actin-binding protein-like [Cyclospora cayetanensis]
MEKETDDALKEAAPRATEVEEEKSPSKTEHQEQEEAPVPPEDQPEREPSPKPAHPHVESPGPTHPANREHRHANSTPKVKAVEEPISEGGEEEEAEEMENHKHAHPKQGTKSEVIKLLSLSNDATRKRMRLQIDSVFEQSEPEESNKDKSKGEEEGGEPKEVEEHNKEMPPEPQDETPAPILPPDHPPPKPKIGAEDLEPNWRPEEKPHEATLYVNPQYSNKEKVRSTLLDPGKVLKAKAALFCRKIWSNAKQRKKAVQAHGT